MQPEVTRFFQAGGTLELGAFYVPRPADEELPRALRQGEYCHVLAPRQIGKSSLRVATEQQLREGGTRCVTIDLTRVGSRDSTAEQWYYSLIDEIARQLGLPDPAAQWTAQDRLSPVYRFGRFMREQVVEQIPEPVVIFIDEIDAVLTLNAVSRDDFFATIRALYNARADDPAFKRLSFCLIGVALPGDLIQDETKTPFNIGRGIFLEDFTREQMDALAPGLQQARKEAGPVLDAIYDWTSGHPYMTLKICQELAEGEAPSGEPGDQVEAVVKQLYLRRGRVQDANLAYAEKHFSKEQTTARRAPGAQAVDSTDPAADPAGRTARMLRLYRRIRAGEKVPAQGQDTIQMALRLTGMAAERRDEEGLWLRVRNRIFATVFDQEWAQDREGDRFLKVPLTRWVASGKNDDYVPRGQALEDAQQWARGREDVTPEEREYLLAGLDIARREEQARQMALLDRQRREQAEAQARLSRRVVLGLVPVTLVLLAALGFAAWQYFRATESQRKTENALQQAKEAAAAEGTARRAAEDQRQKAEVEKTRADAEKQKAESAAEQARQAQRSAEEATREQKKAVRVQEQLRQEAELQRADAEDSRQQIQKFLNDARSQRDRAERARKDLEAAERNERDATALTLSQQPGKEIEAMFAAIQAIGPRLGQKEGRENLMQTRSMQGLVQAVLHGGYWTPLRGHTAGITAVAFSPEGTRVLTGSADGTARVWDARTGHQVLPLMDLHGKIVTAMFAPDGKTIAVAEEGGSVSLWGAWDGKMRSVLKHGKSMVRHLAYCPNASQLAIVMSDDSVQLWAPAQKLHLLDLVGHLAPIEAVAFSRDCRRLATASQDGTARIWDGQGRLLATLRGHNKGVSAVAFSADGSLVLTAGHDQTARIWDGRTYQEKQVLKGHADAITDATFIQGDRRVLTTSEDHTARIWSIQGSQGEPLILQGHEAAVLRTALSRQGSAVLMASADGDVRLWDRGSGRQLDALPASARLPGPPLIALSPDGSRALVASPGSEEARLWELRTGQDLLTLIGHSGALTTAHFSHDGRRVLTASLDHTARLWDATTGHQLATLRGHTKMVRGAAFSPSGSMIVTASMDGTARLWDGRGGEPGMVLHGHTGPVRDALFSPTGSTVLTISEDHTAILWDIHGGRPLHVLKGHTDTIDAAAFSGDGKLIATSGKDRSVLLWDGNSERPVASLAAKVDGKTGLAAGGTGHSAGITALAFAPSGALLATASRDRSARIWRIGGGIPLTLSGHGDVVNTVEFSGDSKRVLTASADRTALLWSAEDGQQLVTLSGHTDEVNYATFSPGSDRIATASEDRTARLWDAATGVHLATYRGHQSAISHVEFSSDGTRILTAGEDGTARIYPASAEGFLLLACNILHRNKDFDKVRSYCEAYLGKEP